MMQQQLLFQNSRVQGGSFHHTSELSTRVVPKDKYNLFKDAVKSPISFFF